MLADAAGSQPACGDQHRAGEAQPRRSALRTGSELEKSRKVLDNSIFRCSQINRWSMARSSHRLGGPVRSHHGQFGQPGLGCCVDGCGRQGGQCSLGERGDAALRGGARAHCLDDRAQFTYLRISQSGANRGP